jgi:hypothetical protein
MLILPIVRNWKARLWDDFQWRSYQCFIRIHPSVFVCLVFEAIGTAATPGLLCQPRVIVKMIVEQQMECRLAGETEFLGENVPQRHFCPSRNSTWPDPDLNPGRRGGKPATNRLSYSAAHPSVTYRQPDRRDYLCMQFSFHFHTNSCRTGNSFSCFSSVWKPDHTNFFQRFVPTLSFVMIIYLHCSSDELKRFQVTVVWWGTVSYGQVTIVH